jgi:hypothetical protein
MRAFEPSAESGLERPNVAGLSPSQNEPRLRRWPTPALYNSRAPVHGKLNQYTSPPSTLRPMIRTIADIVSEARSICCIAVFMAIVL